MSARGGGMAAGWAMVCAPRGACPPPLPPPGDGSARGAPCRRDGRSALHAVRLTSAACCRIVAVVVAVGRGSSAR
jgi:hypothetical protein